MKDTNSKINNKNGVKYITYPNLDSIDFVLHATSTRYGGVSQNPYTASMNLGFKTDDDISLIKQNYKLFCDAVGFDYDNLARANQIHSDKITIITKKSTAFFENPDYNCDALITNVPGIPLAIVTADCTPVLFCDKKKKVIAVAHCGWKGTYDTLQQKVIDKMVEVFKCKKEDILVSIGVCVHSCCYEVSESLAIDFKSKFPFLKNEIINKNKSYYLDLSQINKSLLVKNEIPEKNIFVSDLCTVCNSDDFFSHRVMGFKRGMIATLIQIKEGF